MEPTNKKKKKEICCPCKRVKCARFGDCDACRKHHLEQGDPPYCERPAGRQSRERANKGL